MNNKRGETPPCRSGMKTSELKSGWPENNRLITLFLAGDVMTGRGIDQILPHPGNPTIYEDYIKDARGYITLAERASGPIPRSARPSYIWGDALDELKRETPDVRIVNLETSVTKSDAYWKGKKVHYRMHPENMDAITAAGIDVCSLANNHVLDWGYEGLRETLAALEKAKIKCTGAGLSLKQAVAPTIMELEGKGRVIVFACGSATSGIPPDWAATEERPGINLLPDFSEETVRSITDGIREVKRDGDIIVFSIHWGANWDYDISGDEARFAHQVIDAGADVIHGHSSHHVKRIEVYHDRPILYGCGDFLNDYEGIASYDSFWKDLGLMYFLSMDPRTGTLVQGKLVPMRIERFKLNRAAQKEAHWLADILNRESRRFGTEIVLSENKDLALLSRTSPGS